MVRNNGFDVIVIGGGWGGMSTAALLARKGLKTLLLESGRALGGRASYSEREGFVVDYGIHGHRFGSAGMAAKVYAELGEKLDLVEPGPGIIRHGGRDLDSPSSPLDFARTRLLSLRGKVSAGKALARIAARSPGKSYNRTVDEFLGESMDSEARFLVSVLCGMGLISPDLGITSAGEFSWFLRKAARAGETLAFPRGGCSQHVRRLRKIIEESGEVRTGFSVERIVVSSRTVSGVEGKQGTFDSRAVVAALPLPLIPALIPEGAIDPDRSTRMRGVEPTMGLSWDVGLRESVADVHVVSVTEPLIMGAFSSNIDPDLCPHGKQLCTWCMPLPPSGFENNSLVKKEEGRLRETVLDMFPLLGEKMEWDRMLRLGMIDGAIPSSKQPWPDRVGPMDSGVGGLFLAGDSVGVPGQGGDVAFTSALECARAVTSYLR